MDNIVSCVGNYKKYNYKVLVIGFVFPSKKCISLLGTRMQNFHPYSFALNFPITKMNTGIPNPVITFACNATFEENV